jgi:propionate CoA-transferase
VENKVVSAAEAVAMIRYGDTVAISGFVGTGTPEELLIALADRFQATQTPGELTLVFAAAPGDGRGAGADRLAQEGLVARAIGGHWALLPNLGRLATANKIEAYNLPLGCIAQLFRDIASGKPGMLSRIGLHTFVDPRHGGGRINERTSKHLVSIVEIDGEEWLLYRAFPIHVALIRGTTADINGNITMEREALTLDALAIATATRNSKGLVIAQVERVAEGGSLKPKDVIVPGTLVDCVVVARPGNHQQTYKTPYKHEFAGEMRVPIDTMEPLPLDIRKVIARRATLELPMNSIINLGIGMPEGVANVANEERILDYLTLTAEPGIVGGVPQRGLDFGAAINADAIIMQSQQFDFYDGGGLDLACLGMAQVDAAGNVNVSRFGERLAGAGGFINISQSAGKMVFVGTFTAGGLDVAVTRRGLVIRREGRQRKFIRTVEQITFNGAYAARLNRPVLYVTERCVLQLTPDGPELIEVAPGIDIERDILAQMDFAPIVRDPKPMARKLFSPQPMGLRKHILGKTLRQRFVLDAANDTLQVDFSGFCIDSPRDLTRIRTVSERILSGHGRRVVTVTGYDAFSIRPEISGPYFDLVAELERKYFIVAARYATSTFMRFKLAAALERRGLVANVFPTRHEALAFVGEPYHKLRKSGPVLRAPDDGHDDGHDDRTPLGAQRIEPETKPVRRARAHN